MNRVAKFSIFACSFILFQCANNPTEPDFRARWSDSLMAVDEQANTLAEVRFGRDVAARMLVDIDGVEDRELQTYVNTLGKYLAQYAARPEIDFYFWVIESETINAYAIPGGYIFITSGAYRLLTNEAELAGVLAHEIAHVKQKHIVNALDIKAVGSGASLTQLTSGASDAFRIALGQATEQAVTLLTADGLQQTDEFEADEIGLTIMVQAGYSPDAYVNYLQRVSQHSGEPVSELSQTHPTFTERLANLADVKTQYGMNNLNYAIVEERFARYRLD